MTDTIFFTAPTFRAGYLDTRKGETYCHCVIRSFRPEKFLTTDKEMPIEEFLKICPLDKTIIKRILDKGKQINNIFEDIHNGTETYTEFWEWGHLYESNWERTETKASDIDWYAPYTYRNREKEFKKTVKTI